uniref:TRAP transporter large permease n=1 Tax=Roseovarius indicus TaxID=540747 RepID=UPI003B52960B
MDRFEIGLVGIASALTLIMLKVPVGVVLAIVSFGGIWAVLNINAALGMLSAIPYRFVANWSFSAVPMFLLMGYIASHAGLTSGLFRFARLLLHKVPGALACSTVGASALFAAASGSSVATAAAMSKIAIPEMRKLKYDDALSAGCVSAAGTLGSMIPPSVLLIIYGVFTQQPIGKLFIAGILPGVLTAVVYMIGIVIRVKLKPELAPNSTTPRKPGELLGSLVEVWLLPILILGVIGGIFTGIMTSTEAGAVGASLAILIAVTRGTFNVRMLFSAVRDTALGTSSIFIIAMGASMFTTFMGLAGLPSQLASWVSMIDLSALTLILLVTLIYLVLGCFIESMGVMLLTLPFLIPLAEETGIDMIWFGILIVKLLEIGLITPPFGLNNYIIHSSMRGAIPLVTIFRGVSWFVVFELLVLAMLIAFPAIALWLPSLMQR